MHGAGGAAPLSPAGPGNGQPVSEAIIVQRGQLPSISQSRGTASATAEMSNVSQRSNSMLPETCFSSEASQLAEAAPVIGRKLGCSG